MALAVAILWVATPPWAFARSKSKQNSEQTRADYISRVQQQNAAPVATTLGSLYIPNAGLAEMAADYKARTVGDLVTLVVFDQTAAKSTADVNSQRAFQTSSAITGLPGAVSTGSVNPLFSANSATTLKGQGETSAGSNITTTLAARVIAVLSNGNMVVEAERHVLINSQHDTVIVRGVLRPGDVGPNNMASSTALANLELEIKGKGTVSDGIRRTNPVIRRLLWLIGF
jgi:flagellar L-ring protein precursor FlgH